MLQTLAYRNKDNLHFGAIVAGHDKYNGPSLYEIALGGTLVKTNFALAGSGSGSIYSWFDKNWKDNMSADQARYGRKRFSLREVPTNVCVSKSFRVACRGACDGAGQCQRWVYTHCHDQCSGSSPGIHSWRPSAGKVWKSVLWTSSVHVKRAASNLS